MPILKTLNHLHREKRILLDFFRNKFLHQRSFRIPTMYRIKAVQYRYPAAEAAVDHFHCDPKHHEFNCYVEVHSSYYIRMFLIELKRYLNENGIYLMVRGKWQRESRRKRASCAISALINGPRFSTKCTRFPGSLSLLPAPFPLSNILRYVCRSMVFAWHVRQFNRPIVCKPWFDTFNY